MRLNMKLRSLLLLTLGFLCIAFSAQSQELVGVQEQIDALKEEMIILQRKVYRDTTDSPTYAGTGKAEVKLGEYDEIIRTMNGKIDEIEYQVKQLEKKIETINHDFDIRFKLLEGKPIPAAQNGAATPEKFGPAIVTGAPKSITGDTVTTGELKSLQPNKNADVDDLYKQGLEALKNGNSALAEQNFMIILDCHQQSKLAGNAQYWLGEVYYKDKNFAKAAVAFGKGYEQYKDSAKGADSLLKLGLSMEQLGKKAEACLAFTNIPAEFPKADKSILEKAKLEANKLKCQ